MSPERSAARLARQAAGADIVVVEGVMGLYDGGHGGAGSTASLAALTGLPVLLVVGAQGLAQTAAAVAEGCARLAEGFPVVGAIVNQVASERHADLIREGFRRASVPLLGLVRRDRVDRASVAASRAGAGGGACGSGEEDRAGGGAGGGGMRSRSDRRARAPAERLLLPIAEKVAAEQPDEGLRRSSTGSLRPQPLTRRLRRHPLPARGRVPHSRPSASASPSPAMSPSPSPIRISCRTGASRARRFPSSRRSPTKRRAPDADAVFLPGGYPELYAGRIAAAAKFRAGMQAAAKRGALIYGECGGYMVLGDSLIDAEGTSHRMLGLLPVSTSFEKRKLHLGYRRLTPLGDLPWRVAAHGA